MIERDRDSIPEIELTNRCERDGARAYVATTVPHADGLTTLYWCAHHYRQHHEALKTVAVAIRNEESKLAAREVSV